MHSGPTALAQLFPQRPQLAGSRRSASHPSDAMPLQFPKLASQAKLQLEPLDVTAQTPWALKLAGGAQRLPQAPQFAGLARVLVSHPSEGSWLQSA